FFRNHSLPREVHLRDIRVASARRLRAPLRDPLSPGLGNRADTVHAVSVHRSAITGGHHNILTVESMNRNYTLQSRVHSGVTGVRAPRKQQRGVTGDLARRGSV